MFYVYMYVMGYTLFVYIKKFFNSLESKYKIDQLVIHPPPDFYLFLLIN